MLFICCRPHRRRWCQRLRHRRPQRLFFALFCLRATPAKQANAIRAAYKTTATIFFLEKKKPHVARVSPSFLRSTVDSAR